MVHFVEFGEFYYSTSQVLTNDFDRMREDKSKIEHF